MRFAFALVAVLISSRAHGQWVIQNDVVPLQVDASNQPYFDFPVGTPFRRGVNYLTRSVDGFAGAKGLSMQFTVSTTGTPAFDWRTKANNTCAGSKANVRLFIWRSPDMTSQTGRYWAQAGYADIAAGTITIGADFDPAKWSDVMGELGSKNPAAFADALKYATQAGVTFGGGCFYGHGVFVVSGTGSARFTVNAFGAY
ncbi:MAG: hypothetical protein ACR652_06545 [Methylocystis sp.]|uniref:hypothetical protein n=1 Tax=Methylocystis sp. TaxID=1911079 RepID=UPI003DA3C7E5